MKWKPAPVFLPGEFHGQRNPAGYSPWSCKKSDTNKRLSTHSHTSGVYSGVSPIKNPLANAGDPGSIPGSGRPPGEGNGCPL